MAWRRLKSRKRGTVLAVCGAIAVAAVAITAVALRSSGGTAVIASSAPTGAFTAIPSPTATNEASPTPIRFAGILDGAPMSEQDWTRRKDSLPVAVMVGNSPDAYPHAGLDRADLVYEAFVEGGITRMMAVYWRRDAEFVEPVRSARTPFLIWADELGALYAHGGEADTNNAANAGGQLYDWKILDLNAFIPATSSAFYRDPDRYAPHNLVTGTTALRQVAANVGYAGPPRVDSWRFRSPGDAALAGSPAAGIEINFQGTRYPWQLIQWHWDPATKSYARFQFGGPHLDAKTNEQLRFANVVVMRVPALTLETGHVVLDQFGAGPATVFLEGRQIEGTWRKADRKGRTRFFDASGMEIAFSRGPVFIEVVGPQSAVVVGETVAALPKIPAYEPPPPALPEPDDTPFPSPTVRASPSASPAPSKTPTGTPGSSTGTPAPSRTASPGTPGATAPASTPATQLPTATHAVPPGSTAVPATSTP